MAELPPMKEVFSDMVSKIGYDPGEKILFVQWANTGRITEYLGVPSDVAMQAMNNWSIGEMISRQIKGVYSFRYYK